MYKLLVYSKKYQKYRSTLIVIISVTSFLLFHITFLVKVIVLETHKQKNVWNQFANNVLIRGFWKDFQIKPEHETKY